jgi:hypothetical protein
VLVPETARDRGLFIFSAALSNAVCRSLLRCLYFQR